MKRTKRQDLLEKSNKNPGHQPPPTTKPKNRVQPGTFLDVKIYHRAKVQAMTEGITTGELIDRAILLYLSQIDPINKEDSK